MFCALCDVRMWCVCSVWQGCAGGVRDENRRGQRPETGVQISNTRSCWWISIRTRNRSAYLLPVSSCLLSRLVCLSGVEKTKMREKMEKKRKKKSKKNRSVNNTQGRSNRGRHAELGATYPPAPPWHRIAPYVPDKGTYVHGVKY